MHKLVLLRHGESTWNQENRFTGWADVDLTEQGRQQAADSAGLIQEAGLDFDLAFTSVLKRAIRTLWITLDGMDRLWLPVKRGWELNERHYGALQGLNKAETAAKYGDEQVLLWRRGYDVLPPLIEAADERFPGHDRRYQDLRREQLPLGESLANTIDRVVPYWQQHIAPAVQSGQRVLVVAHGNSLRGLVKHLGGLSDEAVLALNIPTGTPLVYELGEDLTPLRDYYYLGDADAIARAQAAIANQGRSGG